MSRSLRAFVLVCGAASLAVACSDGAVRENPELKSAGRLPESRLPYGIWGDSPAPTGARARDITLETAWYKRAKGAEKAPSHNDSPSGATPRF